MAEPAQHFRLFGRVIVGWRWNDRETYTIVYFAILLLFLLCCTWRTRSYILHLVQDETFLVGVGRFGL